MTKFETKCQTMTGSDKGQYAIKRDCVPDKLSDSAGRGFMKH